MSHGPTAPFRRVIARTWPARTPETLGKLRPAFAKDGTVTAGNAAGNNDGGSGVVLARESATAERGLTPLVSLEAVVSAAMDPS